MYCCWTKCFYIQTLLIEWVARTSKLISRCSNIFDQYFCTPLLSFPASSSMNGDFDSVRYGNTNLQFHRFNLLCVRISLFFSVSRANYPLVTELGNSRDIHDLHQGNIVEELTLHSDYYSEIRGQKKQYLSKRRNVPSLRPNCKNWEFVEEKTDFGKVIVPRVSLSVESIPIFRTVQYFNSV